ncbi:MAG: NAD(P)-dependent oxidoreductase, partial [Clostridia bacterium]
NSPLIELAGKTMGIIGFGKIGQAVGKIASALQMNIVYFDQADIACDYAKKLSLDELLATSDVISLHCPLFDSTQGIICSENIAKMKDGVIILNTSRGPLIVENDLVSALDSGKVACAAMDVVSAEPITANNPLLKAKNCIITPHIAWATKEARFRLMNIAADNLKAFQDGKAVNIVNK